MVYVVPGVYQCQIEKHHILIDHHRRGVRVRFFDFFLMCGATDVILFIINTKHM